MYKSPIEITQHRIICDSSKQLDEAIFTAVVRADIHVDRNELVKALQYDRNQYEKGFEDGKAEAAKWISVKDRLPEMIHVDEVGLRTSNRCYVCGIDEYGIKHVALSKLLNGKWVLFGKLRDAEVTHWMDASFPEPPKEDSK